MENVLNETVCPIDIEWTLNKADLVNLTDIQDGYLEGEYIFANNIPGLQYYLQIYPNGFCEDCIDRTWIFFNFDGLEERKITAEFTVSVKSANFSETYNFVYKDEMEYGMDICGTSEFYNPQMKYFIDGNTTIKVNGTLKTKYPFIPEIVCPIDSEWKFKKADLMDLMDSENKSLKGKFFYAFNIPGLRYRIEIYPNGDNEEHRGETWIFFHVKIFNFGDRNITADLKIVVESSNLSKSLKDNFKDDVKHGDRICKMDEFFDPLKKYFVNGEITIKVKGILKTCISSKSIIANSICMQWKIKEADLKEVVEDESKDRSLFSDVKKDASFSGVSCYHEFRPKEINDDNEVKVFTYLHVDFEKDENIGAVLDLSVETTNFNQTLQGGCSVSFGLGTFLCYTKDLFDPTKEFIVNGYLTLNFNGILIKEENDRSITLNCNNGVSSKSTFEMDDKDFLLVVGEEEIQVHKQVLTEVSPVFAEMLESGTKESIIENKMYISNFTFKTVQAAIKLCYGINVSLKYSLENLLSLFKFGHKYRISLIMDLIEEYLIKDISPSNVVCLIKFSAPDSFNIKKLYQSCIAFLMKCSKDSTPVYASESLGEPFLAAMILNTFSSKC